MVGSVTADYEAVLAVVVLSLSGSGESHVEAIVDTGFTGHLTLRPETVDRLGLPMIGSAESVLADGSITIEDVCLARVIWHEIPRSVQALVADAVPLLGMSLLRGSELCVEAKAGGEVKVRSLP